MRNVLSWNVLYYNINTNKVEEYNILKYNEHFIKTLKKKCGGNKEEFDKKLKSEMMYRYWARCEYELLIELKNNEIYVKPWCGCCNPEEVKTNVTNNNLLEWASFALQENMIYYKDGTCKIDIYDQLQFRWQEFVDYCWNTRLPYERKRYD